MSSSMDTTMEDEDSFISSSRDGIIYGTSDYSGWGGESMISGPNITSSSTSTDRQQQQKKISAAAAGGGTDDLMIVSSSSSASSSWFQKNKPREIRIFNVDFRALSQVALGSTSNKDEEEEEKVSEINKKDTQVLPRFEFLGDLLKIGGAVKNETSIRLVNTLMACGDAVQHNNLNLADALVRELKSILAVQQFGAMKNVATYFADALDRRIHPQYNPQNVSESSYYIDDPLWMSFYEDTPYLKFAHFAANQAILEAFADFNRVHVIDFSLKHGMQWPSLMQALALRPGGPPIFRLTGIGPYRPDNTDVLQKIGLKLAQFAEVIGIAFEFQGFEVSSLADVDATLLNVKPGNEETLAVNSVFELHHVLSRPGAIEKLLNSIKEMQPKIVTISEQEANLNGHVFTDRFNEAWKYYSTMFDSMGNSEMAEKYLGQKIHNVVACFGTERIERHETLWQWRVRMNSAGFIQVHRGSNTFKQATRALPQMGSRDGHRVDRINNCLMLSWHFRPLIATSAWQPLSRALLKLRRSLMIVKFVIILKKNRKIRLEKTIQNI